MTIFATLTKSHRLFHPFQRVWKRRCYTSKTKSTGDESKQTTAWKSAHGYMASELAVLPSNSIVSLALTVPIGPRFEHYQERGLSHMLKSMMFKSNSVVSQMAISRMTEISGSQLKVLLSRESLTLYAEAPRNDMRFAVGVLGESLANLKGYQKHEYLQAQEAAYFETVQAHRHAEYFLLEALHRIAFGHYGLGNALLAADWRLHYHGPSLESMIAYKRRLAAGSRFRYSLVGLGMESEELSEIEKSLVAPAFQSLVESCRRASQSDDEKDGGNLETKIIGGEEFIEGPTEGFHLAVAYPTVGFCDATYPTLLVLQAYLAGADSASTPLMPYASGPGIFSRAYYGKRPANIEPQKSFSTFNLAYSDAGLLGFRLSATNHACVYERGKHVVQGLYAAGKDISDGHFKRAQALAKFLYASRTESRLDRAEDIGRQLLLHEGFYRTTDQVLAAIASVKLDDLQKMVKELIHAPISAVLYGTHLSGESFLDRLPSPPKRR